MSAVAPRLAEGTPVIIADTDRAHVHLPAESLGCGCETFDERTRREGGHVPSTWRGVCGVKGSTWLYRAGLFGSTREICRGCTNAA